MPDIHNINSYYIDDDRDMRHRMDESYRQAVPLVQQYWNDADIDIRFKAGDQTLWNQNSSLPIQTKRTFQFNRIRRIINMPCGYQRKNRKTTIVVPMENADQQAADDFSGLIQWANQYSNFYPTLSESFEGAVTTGFNLLSIWMDYNSDPISGDIKITNLHHNGCLVDPTFKKRDLSDANYIWTRRWMSKGQAKTLLPGREKDIDAMQITARRDDKFMYLPENYQFSLNGFVTYDEYWYLDSRPTTVLIDMESGETMEWPGTDEALEIYRRDFPNVQTKKIQKPTVKLAIAVNNRIFYNGPNPYQIDRFPFVGVFGYFEPEIPYFSLKMQGMVRGLRDAQYLYTRRRTIELDILESQINSGIKFKETALVDPDDAFLTGQGRRLALRASASMDDVEVIQPPQIPQGMFEMSKTLGDEITQISGVNEELLGAAEDDKSGLLSMLRQGAGLTTLQTLFDQLDDSQKQAGQIYMDMIQANFSVGKVRRILNREPSEQFKNKAFQKFDCQVEEGVMTSTQKQMEFQQLLALRQMDIQIPTEILINAAPLQNKANLINAMKEQEQQQAQQAQMQMQNDMQQQQVLTNSLAAKAESDRALASERMNKIQTDQAMSMEKIAQSQQHREGAVLDRVRAAKELADMDLTQMQKMLDILTTLQQQEVATEQQNKVNLPGMPQQPSAQAEKRI